jgi:hypothetical protein
VTPVILRYQEPTTTLLRSNQSEYNATSSITLSALPNNSDEDMLDYLYWENSLGESGYQYTSTFTIPFLDGNYSFWARLYQEMTLDIFFTALLLTPGLPV